MSRHCSWPFKNTLFTSPLINLQWCNASVTRAKCWILLVSHRFLGKGKEMQDQGNIPVKLSGCARKQDRCPRESSGKRRAAGMIFAVSINNYYFSLWIPGYQQIQTSPDDGFDCWQNSDTSFTPVKKSK